MSGRVLDAGTGQPIAGARVTITGRLDESARPPEALKTKEDGGFVSDNPWRTALVKVTNDGYALFQVSLPGGTSAAAGVYRLEREIALRGTVVAADSGRRLPAVVLVQTRRGADSAIRTVQSRDGTFLVEKLPSGPASVIVRSRGWASEGQRILLPRSGGATTVEFRLRRPATITGQIVSEDQKPLRTARISVRYDERDEGTPLLESAVGEVMSDQAGRFRLDGLRPFVPLRLLVTWNAQRGAKRFASLLPSQEVDVTITMNQVN